jgi:hypothetical protein
MLRLIRRMFKEPLVYRLVRELSRNQAPMKANDLIDRFAPKCGEKPVRRELDKMVECGIIIVDTFHWRDGFGEGWIPYVRLPEQTRWLRTLGLQQSGSG